MGDMEETAARRAIIYTRISKDDSGEGKSNARQEEDCRAFARLRGYDVVGVESDVSFSAYSGKTRPAWTRVLEAIEAGTVDVVLSWKVDRITRTVSELVSIIEICQANDVGVVTVDGDLDLSTAQGRAVATILGSISQMEVERKSERQRRSNAQARAEGQPWRSGWASFGYDRGKTVIPEQAAMIRKAAADVLDGATLKSIAREWIASGVSTPRSSKGADGWTHNGVKSILLNPVNAGINTYKGEEIGPGAWEAIIPESTLRELQALLGDPSRRTNAGSGRRAENLLSGIATCGRCGRAVVAGISNGRKVYKCSNPSGEHITTDRAEADAFVLGALTRGTEVFANYRVLPDAGDSESTDDVMADLASLDRREQAITQRFTEGLIEEETWTSALGSIKAQREALTDALAQSSGDRRTVHALAQARIDSFLSLPLHDKRLTLGAVARVELHPRNRRRNVPIGEQVSVWAADPRRSSPLIAGSHVNSLERRHAVTDQ